MKIWCPECGCSATKLIFADGTVYGICDDPECAYACLTEADE